MTMIERVARAIAGTIAMAADPVERARWIDGMWPSYERQARAALTAMREPTAAMITAAAWTDGEQTAREVWRDMIDAALNDNGDIT